MAWTSSSRVNSSWPKGTVAYIVILEQNLPMDNAPILTDEPSNTDEQTKNPGTDSPNPDEPQQHRQQMSNTLRSDQWRRRTRSLVPGFVGACVRLLIGVDACRRLCSFARRCCWVRLLGSSVTAWGFLTQLKS
nr:hypothetical protein CFP56_49923 [Quercus suber]